MLIRQPPVTFVDGGTISPRDVNRNLSHLARQVADLQAKRYAHCDIRIPFHRSTSTPYTEADVEAVREFVLRFPCRVTIERGYFRYYGSGDAAVNIALEVLGSPVSGAGDPYLTVTPSASDGAVAGFNGNRIVLEADTNYTLRIESTGTFSSKNTFVELHLRADRFNIAGAELLTSYVPGRFSSADARDADVLNAEFAALEAAIASVTANTVFTRAEVYVFHDLSSSTGASETVWPLPVVDSADTSRNLVGLYARADREASSSAAQEAAWLVKDAAGVTQATATLNVLSFSALGVANETVDLELATAGGDHSDAAEDWELVLDHVSGSETLDKVSCILFYA